MTVFVALAGTACSRADGGTSGAADAGDEGGTTGPEEPYPTPVLLEPSGDAVRIDADRTDPLLLSALGTVAGRTQVAIDGRTVAVSDQSGPYGALTGGIGNVALRGAMVESRHTLRLVTPGETTRLESRAVELVVVAGMPGTASFETTATLLAPDVLGGGAPLVNTPGVASDEPAPWWTWRARDVDPTLPLATVRVTFSRPDAPDRELELTKVTRDRDGRPWLRVGPGARGETAVLVWLSGPEARVAWRRALVLDASPDTVASPPVALLDLDDPSLDALAPTRSEVASLRGIDVLDGRAIVELDASLDAESLRPGDHVLVAFDPVPSTAASADAPLLGVDVVDGEVASIGGPIDVDLLGSSIDVDGVARGVSGLAARIAGDRARPLEWQQGVAALRINDDDLRDTRPAFASRWLSATLVLGSLASRTWLARTDEDQLQFAAYDARVPEPTVVPVTLDAPLRYTPAAVVLGGQIVALVPLGAASEAVVLTISGTNVRQAPIAGLRCEWAVLGAPSSDGRRARWLCGDGVAVREGVVTWSLDE
jgi:hypothetical protein